MFRTGLHFGRPVHYIILRRGIAVNRNIVITKKDLERLEKLILNEREFGKLRESQELKSLEQELSRARVVKQEDIPNSVITMNSHFLLKNIETNEEETFVLVYPEDADYIENKISIMAPIGTAMLGYNEGDEITWNVPDGTVHYRVEKILYQPEASGDFDL